MYLEDNITTNRNNAAAAETFRFYWGGEGERKDAKNKTRKSPKTTTESERERVREAKRIR